jgi:hypothetical protein
MLQLPVKRWFTKERHILTEEKLDKVAAGSEAGPKKSLRRLALQCFVSLWTAQV